MSSEYDCEILHVHLEKRIKNIVIFNWPHFLSLQHPQIQKESQYIKYLCCDDKWSMNLWVTGIRIAKVQLIDSFLKILNITIKKYQLRRDSCSLSMVLYCMKTSKLQRRRLLSVLCFPTAALHQAPANQPRRPPLKVQHTYLSCLNVHSNATIIRSVLTSVC